MLCVSITRERFQWRGTNRWDRWERKTRRVEGAGRRIPLKTIPFDDVAPRPSASYLHSRSALLPLREYAGTFMPSSFNPVTVTKRGNKFFFLLSPLLFFLFSNVRKQKKKKKKRCARTNFKPNQTKPGIFALSARRRREEPLFPPKSSLSTAKRLTYCTERVQWKY